MDSWSQTGVRALVRLLATTAGIALGAIGGLLVTLAIVVAKARLGSFLFSIDDLYAPRLETVVLVASILLGAFYGFARSIKALRAFIRAISAMVPGALVGTVFALVAGLSSEAVWSAGFMTAVLFFVAGFILALWKVKRKTLSRMDAQLGIGLAVVGCILIAFSLRPPQSVDAPVIEPEPFPPLHRISDVVFLVGDMGATTSGKSPILDALRGDVDRWSAALQRDSAVSVIYAGDLVYPVGIRERDHPMFATDSSRLWNQIDIVGSEVSRAKRTRGILLAGNHDWGNMTGAPGVARLNNLNDQLKLAQSDGYAVELVPEPGSPGPLVRDVRDNLRFVYIDTHWFLQEHSDNLRNSFLQRLREAVSVSDDRHVIISSHHPFNSAGSHGSLLPGFSDAGIEYLMSRTGALVQDLNSPIYRKLLEGMRTIFAEAPNPPLIFLGGHDHSLQVIESVTEGDPSYSLVSGSGSKLSDIGVLPGLQYGASRPGYMMLVIGTDESVKLFVVAGDPQLLKCTPGLNISNQGCMTLADNRFDIVFGKTLAEGVGEGAVADLSGEEEDVSTDDDNTRANTTSKFPDEPDANEMDYAWWTSNVVTPDMAISESDEAVNSPVVAVPARKLYFRPDSVRTTTGASYAPSNLLHQLALGELNRDLWDLPIKLPVLDIDQLGGGITVDEITGGMQTFGLKLDGQNSVTYQFRSIVKDASRALDNEIAMSVIGGTLEDQLSAQFPLAAMVVAELLKSVGVLVATPRPVIMPNDSRLGNYRPFIAGRVGWIEERPNEGEDNTRGFAGSRKVVSGTEIYDELLSDPLSYVDVHKYLRARMIDFLVGDWDRHSDNWRWARFDDNGRHRWEPIPRDRDWAFPRAGGAIQAVSSVGFPRFVGYSDEMPPLDRLASSSYRIDHRILSGATRVDFVSAADSVQKILTDDVLEKALSVLPPEYYEAEHDFLINALQARREMLDTLAVQLDDLVSQTVHIYGHTDVEELIKITNVDGGNVLVQIFNVDGSGSFSDQGPRFARTVNPEKTTSLRLHLEDELDTLEHDENLPINLTVVDPDTESDEYREY